MNPEAIYEAVLTDRRQCGLFLFDDQWRWTGGNEGAERMLAAGWWRGHPGGRIGSPSVVTRVRWHAAQRALGAADASAAPTVPVYDAQAVLVAFASVQRSGATASSGQASGYALFVRPLHGPDDRGSVAELRTLFDLTTGEALLATALRRHGNLQQAAMALGIVEGSARTRLQSVFEKTGIHRQAELLCMLDALADVTG